MQRMGWFPTRPVPDANRQARALADRGGKGRWALWWSLLFPYRWALVALIACQIGQSVAGLVLPSLSADVIDKGILANDPGHIALIAGIMLAAAAAQILLAVGVAWFGARIAIDFGRDLRAMVFGQVQSFSLTELRSIGTPSLITRTTNDVQQLQTMLIMILTMVMTAPVMGIGAVVMAIRQDVHLSLLLLVSVPVLGAIIGVLMAKSLPLFSRMQVQIDRVNQVLREQISGIRTIRAFVRDGHEQQRFGKANDELTATALAVGKLMALNMPAVGLVMQVSSIAMVWFGAHRIAAGEMEVGSLVAFITYIAQVLISVMIASMLFALAPRAVISARRIREVLDLPPSVADPAPARVKALPKAAGTEIVFDHVSFAYPRAEAPVLRDVSFTFRPGETLAVIGATGSGKSTIISLVPRLFDVVEGSVRINGVDVRALPLDLLWQQIGLVPQESFLFSGTIADNLRYGRADADDDDLWHALEVAQARDFVSALPNGLAAPVAQGGGNFSGGQRQRLTIARALVRRPAIYLFDDSFSALDYTTDARLRAALARDKSPGSATLIVGQRVNSLRHADTILVIDHGRVIGQGTHEQLMAENAAYREIAQSQHVEEITA